LSKEGTPTPLGAFIFSKEQQASHFLKCPRICCLFVLVISIGIMEKQRTNQSRFLGWVKPAQPWALLYTKGDFRRGSKVQELMNQAILLVESFKLVPRPLHEGPRPKSGKLSLNLDGTVLEGKSIG